MKAFWRLLNYIWPQWHRVALVVASALSIAFFFSLSIATIVPLLKVVMNEEGIRGWVNRNVCVWRYGMNFYVPATSDFLWDPNSNLSFYLLTTEVENKSLSQEAGIKKEDRIIGAGTSTVVEGAGEFPAVRFWKLLHQQMVLLYLFRLNELTRMETSNRFPFN